MTIANITKGPGMGGRFGHNKQKSLQMDKSIAISSTREKGLNSKGLNSLNSGNRESSISD